MSQIFIGGCPRSGTTFLASMLGRAPGTIVTPESYFKDYMIGPKGKPGRLGKRLGWRAHPKFRVWLENEAFRNRMSQISPESFKGKSGLLALVRLYGGFETEDFTWIDHTPKNILNVELLHEVFPEAQFVNIVRDGRSVVGSVLPLPWGPNTFYYGALSWVKSVEAGLGAEQKGSPPVHRVYYEDLTNKPEETLRRLCGKLGLKYSPEILQGGGFEVPSYTRFQHKLVNQSIRRDEGWGGQSKLDRDLEIFESVAGHLCRYLGYPTHFENPNPPGLIERILIALEEKTKKRLNRFKKARRVWQLPR